jgi:hypothetical protein
MTVVFLATDTRTDRRVALARPEAPTAKLADLRGGQWGTQLQKQFCGVGRRGPAVYEYGVSQAASSRWSTRRRKPSDVISRGPLPLDDLTIANELCRFLEHAHGFGSRFVTRASINRRLTSRNVRITSGQQVKVDFIAKTLSLSQ